MNSFKFLLKAMKETHEKRKTKIDIDEFRSGTTNITLMMHTASSHFIVKSPSAPSAEATHQMANRHYEEV